MESINNLLHRIILTLIWTIFFISHAKSQFIYDCNDAEIAVPHIARNNHTYCSHACRYNNIIDQLSVCSPTGACLCVQTCYNGTVPPQPTTQPPNNDLCPIRPPAPINEDPANPNSNAQCLASCARQCPGGFGGAQCTEATNAPALIPRTRICTCACPAQPCVTPTMPPTTIVPVPVPIPSLFGLIPLKKLLLFLKKGLIALWLLCKLFALKIFLFICWRAVLGHYVELDDVKLFLKWFIRYYF